MGDNGWIKLERDIQSHWVYTDPLILKAWIDILLTANHKESKIVFDGNLITIKRGQHMTSIRKLSEKWGCTPRKVLKTLKMFEDEDMISLDSSKRGTLITVTNYSKYQDVRNTKDNTKSNTKSNTYDNIYSYADDNAESIQTRMSKNDYKNDINNAQEKKNSASGGRSIFGGEWEE